MSDQRGYTVLIIMFATSAILLAFSFFVIHRRTSIPLPQGTEAAAIAEPEEIEYEWADFENKSVGIAFKYPKNIFTNPDTKAAKAGTVTRIFLGTSVNGTLSASSIARQFEPGNIIDPSSGKISNASAINVGGKIGYQYQTKYGTCATKVVQVANGLQIVALSFASCASDEDPAIVTNQDLMLGILAGVKLTPQAEVPPPEPETFEGGSLDTLPPGLEIEL